MCLIVFKKKVGNYLISVLLLCQRAEFHMIIIYCKPTLTLLICGLLVFLGTRLSLWEIKKKQKKEC